MAYEIDNPLDNLSFMGLILFIIIIASILAFLTGLMESGTDTPDCTVHSYAGYMFYPFHLGCEFGYPRF